jgi:hypothetical protein
MLTEAGAQRAQRDGFQNLAFSFERGLPNVATR